MTLQFAKATKHESKARIALIGPSGSGKTYSALRIATALGGRVAVIDTEHGSASKYADVFDFDTLTPPDFGPLTYVSAIEAAARAGYDVLVIDSLSHAWSGKGGALEQVDAIAKRSRSSNTFAAWRDVTPQHNALVEGLLAAPMHLIVTMRAKTEYALEKDEKTHKTEVRKIGLAPIQRDGIEYEFDVVGDIDLDHVLVISKTRCPSLDGAIIPKPGEELATTIREWLSGAPKPTPPAPTPPAPEVLDPPIPGDPAPEVLDAPSTNGASAEARVLATLFGKIEAELSGAQDPGTIVLGFVEAGRLIETEADLARFRELYGRCPATLADGEKTAIVNAGKRAKARIEQADPLVEALA